MENLGGLEYLCRCSRNAQKERNFSTPVDQDLALLRYKTMVPKNETSQNQRKSSAGGRDEQAWSQKSVADNASFDVRSCRNITGSKEIITNKVPDSISPEEIPTARIILRHDRVSHWDDIGLAVLKLRNDQKAYDCAVVCGNEKIPAHRSVLVAHSEYCRDMLLQNADKLMLDIPTDGIPFEGLRSVIDYMYTGNLLVTYENAMDILTAVTILKMTPMVNCSVDFVDTLLADENLMTTLELAEKNAIEPLYEEGYRRLAKHFYIQTKLDGFLLWDIDNVTKLLGSDCIVIETELHVFTVAVRWMSYRIQERRQHFRILMKCVRWVYMSNGELMSCIDQEPELLKHHDVLGFLIDATWYATLQQYNVTWKDYVIPPPRIASLRTEDPDEVVSRIRVSLASKHHSFDNIFNQREPTSIYVADQTTEKDQSPAGEAETSTVDARSSKSPLKILADLARASLHTDRDETSPNTPTQASSKPFRASFGSDRTESSPKSPVGTAPSKPFRTSFGQDRGEPSPKPQAPTTASSKPFRPSAQFDNTRMQTDRGEVIPEGEPASSSSKHPKPKRSYPKGSSNCRKHSYYVYAKQMIANSKPRNSLSLSASGDSGGVCELNESPAPQNTEETDPVTSKTAGNKEERADARDRPTSAREQNAAPSTREDPPKVQAESRNRKASGQGDGQGKRDAQPASPRLAPMLTENVSQRSPRKSDGIQTEDLPADGGAKCFCQDQRRVSLNRKSIATNTEHSSDAQARTAERRKSGQGDAKPKQDIQPAQPQAYSTPVKSSNETLSKKSSGFSLFRRNNRSAKMEHAEKDTNAVQPASPGKLSFLVRKDPGNKPSQSPAVKTTANAAIIQGDIHCVI